MVEVLRIAEAGVKTCRRCAHDERVDYMKLLATLRFTAAALVTGALLVPASGPAQAAITYPPQVSTLYASPFLSGGYAAVSVHGDHLTSGIKVRATLGKHSALAPLGVSALGTLGSAVVKVGSLLPSTAQRYVVSFSLEGAAVTGATTTTQTYTVGKAISIKSFAVKRASYGLAISGKAASRTPVKITIKYGTKTYSRSAKASSSGYFLYKFRKTAKGTYTVTAKVAPNKKYFSDSVSAVCVRS